MRKIYATLCVALLLNLMISFVNCDSGSDSNSDSGSGSHEKRGKHNKHHGHQPHSSHSGYGIYNNPAYVPQPTPSYPPYYNLPMHGYYPYGAPPPPTAHYPYGAYYNAQPYYQHPMGYPVPAPQPYTPYPPNYADQASGASAPYQPPQQTQPGATSTINHSLKVNKEYKEDGHHYLPDGAPITNNHI